MNIIIDNWTSNRNQELFVDNADYDTALSFLLKLDGNKHTEIVIKNNQSSLSIAGGNHGYYIINLYLGNENSYILFDKDHKTGELLLTCGGQSAEFEFKYCFKLDFAKNIILDYYNNINILDFYQWEIS